MVSVKVQPDHAYVPGISERHPEGAFDHICQTAQPGMSVSELTVCEAFQTGIVYIDEGYFWEAHEVLEPVWMALTHESEERRFVQGLIQLANGFLKIRMNRPKAACRLSAIAFELLSGKGHDEIMSVSRGKILALVDDLKKLSDDAI